MISLVLAMVVSTSDPQAQKSFDRGLASFYAYDRAGAGNAFASALQQDPNLAMAAWGEALAAAGDLNHPPSPEAFAAAQSAVKHAVSLESHASPIERAYIDALALRYADTWDAHETDERRYVQAMSEIVAAHPLDDDAVTITAEAMLEDREPPASVLALLQPVLQRHPQNVMANHLCIHAYDDLPDRTPVIACADRLSAMTFLPQEEHLAHMPAHAYTETGLYAKAVAASDRAWRLRVAWNAGPRPYELEYGPHDTEVGYAAAMMLGDLQLAQQWATRVEDQTLSSLRPLTLARFGKWAEIVASVSQPNSRQPFALGMAYAHEQDLNSADQQLAELRGSVPDSDLVPILQSAIEERRGNITAAVASLQRAIAIQKRDDTSEYLPLFPAGPALGALYVRAGRYSDARAALQESLTRLPGDPRAFYLLALACTHLGDGPCATAANARFNAIWHEAPPTVADL
ncbi:MAG TPA: tetratricopeptide repeat protein [Candidatus Rubrimentiphilum sp.]|nr:tetratricopeptide repeat protein [Candidatus Rubrimentiphilum sp.]